MAGAVNYPLPLTIENNFLPQYSSIPKEILEKSKLLFLNYPNNPTGAGANDEFFKETVAFAKENNLKIDFSKRETLSSKDLFLKDCKSFVYNLNPALIVKIQNWLYHHSQKK